MKSVQKSQGSLKSRAYVGQVSAVCVSEIEAPTRLSSGLERKYSLFPGPSPSHMTMEEHR